MSLRPHRRALPEAPTRRGWCPGLARPMPTGDGLLARVHPPLGILSLRQARAVAEGARRFGNGHLDLTARANLQIRGVTETSGAMLDRLLTEAGLGDRRRDGGPQRLTLTSPLAGHDPTELIDVLALAGAIETAALSIPGLPAKTLVVVDGRPDAARPEADVSVVARDAAHVAIAIPAGDERPIIADCRLQDAPAALISLLGALVRTGRRRAHDLSAEEQASLVASLRATGLAEVTAPQDGTEATVNAPGRVPFAPACGIQARPDLRILALDAPFGRCGAEILDRVVATAETLGADAIRLSPTRGFVLLARVDTPTMTALAELAGDLIATPDDPRRSIDACTGAPGCASGSTSTLADAGRLATLFRPLALQGLRAHVSGCAKGCARPGPADLTLVARNGLYGIVLDAAPGDEPAIHLPIEAVLDRLGRAKTVGLPAAFASDTGSMGYGRDERPA
ncbi:precorrin-3B synthase [Methylobacterium phyllostachyos]|uniref:Precorrin-3B synthase n=1 Tax=Methylobacterium phyllostachyos TaxID=582672 RepID=A0A1G9WNY4_9HYPH|nr:precorrin-3B synthase [Methylobacterium phyllostachyos]SDM86272.1 precorrin-3B synthase [Methylobacterium phyllostachyos]